MDLFETFPDIQALGAYRLQTLCNEWIQTPVARECGIVQAIIKPEASGFQEVKIQSAAGVRVGEVLHFPADNFLRFVIDREFEGQSREILHAIVTNARHVFGVEAFQRYRSMVDRSDLLPADWSSRYESHSRPRGQEDFR